MPVARLELSVGAPGPQVTLNHRHDLIALVNDSLHLDDPRIEGLSLIHEDGPNRIAASMGSGIRPSLKGDFDLGVGEAEGRLPVAVIERYVDAPHDLDVLLRHRLLPQPGSRASSQRTRIVLLLSRLQPGILPTSA